MNIQILVLKHPYWFKLLLVECRFYLRYFASSHAGVIEYKLT